MSFVLWAPVFVLLRFFGCLSASQVPMHNLLSFCLCTPLSLSPLSVQYATEPDKKSWRSCNPFARSFPSSFSQFFRIFFLLHSQCSCSSFWMVFSKTEFILCSFYYVIAHNKFWMERHSLREMFNVQGNYAKESTGKQYLQIPANGSLFCQKNWRRRREKNIFDCITYKMNYKRSHISDSGWMLLNPFVDCFSFTNFQWFEWH